MFTSRENLITPIFSGPYLCIKYFGIMEVSMIYEFRLYDLISLATLLVRISVL